MIARAEAKYIRISPTKVRPVSVLFKGKNAKLALAQLELINKKAAFHLKKVLHSAVANAKNKGYAEDQLFISKVIANSGPALKRYRAASFGRATLIRKRTSHILVELDSLEKLINKVATKTKAKAKAKPKTKVKKRVK
ncbi:MAG: 50S ribosomal protein L22 [Candidatus Omnitrophica bacterium]|nr:50S ribosomal protein L22 [Candidatus Omnitrophota bacterium]